ncbi:nuclear transport factor 2 family protein [Ferrovibrio sp.]|uniref:nuclear transport factor 2 family protein n=1 Tax=Ferrovibrio sp. TaxID=1917215 RepID=UPI0026080D2E|nr:nuclear transport factor 2 family protein [Ferrovibrio sp.]
MSAAANKQILQQAFARTAQGEGRAFVDILAEDAVWITLGDTAWSKRFEGKAAILRDLLGPLRARFSQPNRVRAERFIAEGDMVAVEARGDAVTNDGQPYRNRYCLVCRMRDGKVVELTEYADTALIDRVLGPPGPAIRV